MMDKLEEWTDFLRERVAVLPDAMLDDKDIDQVNLKSCNDETDPIEYGKHTLTLDALYNEYVTIRIACDEFSTR